MLDIDEDEFPDEWKPFFNVTLLVQHPREDVDIISSELGLQPGFVAQSQQARRVPGTSEETAWAVTRGVARSKRFSIVVDEYLTILEAARDYVRNLIASGGTVRMAVHLPGQGNIGDSLEPSALVRMGLLGVDLSVEVIPDMT